MERRQHAAVDYQRLAPEVEAARQAAEQPRREGSGAYDLEQAAQRNVWAANTAHRQARGFLERRRTERAAHNANEAHQDAKTNYEQVREQHRPVISRHQQLVDQLERHRAAREETLLDRYRTDPAPIEQKLDALTTWREWAVGKPVTETDLITAVTTLRDAAVSNGLDWETRGQYQELAGALTDWAHDSPPGPTSRTTPTPDRAALLRDRTRLLNNLKFIQFKRPIRSTKSDATVDEAN